MKPPLLMLVHRMPYPPDKGDKLRAYQWLRHLASRYRVYLGCFVDDAQDLPHLPTVQALCAGVHVARLHPRLARVRSLAGLVSGQALTLPYFFDAGLAAWVGMVVKAQSIRMAFVYCSAMAQYLVDRPQMRVFCDFVDVDSAKWSAYAQSKRWLGGVYRRESKRLLEFERQAAGFSEAVFFVTTAEAQLFGSLGAELGNVSVLGNGVDGAYFSPRGVQASPYAPGERAVVFTGVMDYWPNVDAVCWFAREVWPQVARQDSTLRFYVVGMRPDSAVRALAGPQVVVTGRVEDVRPYLAHAAAAVAPLRIARGVQNKVLEAMAMARPVVASAICASSIAARSDEELLVADSAADFVGRLGALLADPVRANAIGVAARARVLRDYSWGAQCARLDSIMSEAA